MTKEQVISQLKSLIDDRESFINSSNEKDKNNIFKQDKEALECAIKMLEEKDNNFELIEDEIDNIEEYKQEHTERCIDVDIRNKINELIQAVKHLNKRLEKFERTK